MSCLHKGKKWEEPASCLQSELVAVTAVLMSLEQRRGVQPGSDGQNMNQNQAGLGSEMWVERT